MNDENRKRLDPHSNRVFAVIVFKIIHWRKLPSPTIWSVHLTLSKICYYRKHSHHKQHAVCMHQSKVSNRNCWIPQKQNIIQIEYKLHINAQWQDLVNDLHHKLLLFVLSAIAVRIHSLPHNNGTQHKYNKIYDTTRAYIGGSCMYRYVLYSLRWLNL